MQNSLNDFPTILPVIIEDDFTYPFAIVPIFTYGERNIKAANKALDRNDLVLVCCSKNSDEDKGEFYDVGVVCKILRKVSLPDGRIKILVQGKAIAKVLSIESDEEDEAIEAMVDIIEYKGFNVGRVEAMMKFLYESVQNYANISQFPPEMLKTLEETNDPNRIIDLVASTLRLKKDDAYKLFASDSIEDRMMMLIDLIAQEIQAQKLQKEIKSRVHSKMEKTNREYFLKEQLRQIQKELGTDTQRDEEIERYKEKLKSIKPYLNEDAYKEIDKQISRLSRMHQDSGDANILQNYVEWVLEIPFGKYAKEELSIKKVRKQLDNDHYSLTKPKQRIIEYFAVRELLAKQAKKAEAGKVDSGKDAKTKSGAESKLESIKVESTKADSNKSSDKSDSGANTAEKTRAKGTILCFYGPPGVGKTSLANSIAKAIGRPLVRVALGGLEDVNELRGHRRTYIGAMPGRIVQGLIEAKEMNPVMVLDEIDKVSRGVRGDPTSVLLEILDPEQNVAFRDYYTNFSLDLSQVIFIATANEVATIPAPLRDRMEFIELSSYTPQEKEQIAHKYLIPQELKKHGLSDKDMELSAQSVREIIERYTREAGVRGLRRTLASIMRKVATQILENPKFKKLTITPKMLPDFLDKIVFEIDPARKKPRIGIINGLAWTSVGGDMLKIEAIKLQGKGDLMLTGSLGDVMKESAKIAHSVVKLLLDDKKLTPAKSSVPKSKKSGKGASGAESKPFYNYYDIHLHVPEGATPKDGPSAGIAMACVIASILCDIPIRGDVAMTGELTLAGDVLPIGGLKEKLIAAHKAGIKKVVIPRKNYERDLGDIDAQVLKSMEIIPADEISQVLEAALVKERK
ncbi:endopeptidase La [Helicobacter sp. CLO-3]|uniref:endopeptidase La n=1 Tax=unclassified Helicobacter TaxID=2593540 RepID=UPI0008D9840A|nr:MULTISPECIES: endopeptidase La [unclassified Helicobacter]OHU84085.1 endopeptidase La [Helicobacter sp. CLO-3]